MQEVNMFSYSDKKTVKPLFFLLELTKDPFQRERAIHRLGCLFDAILETAGEKAEFALPFWIHTYGEGSSLGASTYRDYFPFLLEWQLLGTDNVSLAQALEALNCDLSRNKFLRYSLPVHYPTIYILGNPRGLAEDFAALKALEQNPWYPHCQRWVLPAGKPENPEFANRFTGFVPRFLRKNPWILPLATEENVSIRDQLLSGGVPAEFRPDAIRILANPDDLEELIHVDPVIPDASMLSAGVMILDDWTPWGPKHEEDVLSWSSPEDSIDGYAVCEEEIPQVPRWDTASQKTPDTASQGFFHLFQGDPFADFDDPPEGPIRGRL